MDESGEFSRSFEKRIGHRPHMIPDTKEANSSVLMGRIFVKSVEEEKK
jgi:hypothetical protein